MLHFDANNYWLTQFHGDWAMEMRMQESQLTSGIKIIDSKLGTRADMYQTPSFFLSLNKPSGENDGAVIAGTLAWSGNFQFLFELDEKNSLRVVSGMNPFASEYSLEPGKSFVTPEFIFTYSGHGKGPASRNLHSWARNYGVLDGNGKRLTLLNNWESTQFDFDEKKLSGIFSDAAKLGVDLFLLDDGWFGNKYPRNNDHAGLGDWDANKVKLPDGIGYLVKDAESKGVKFGIWLEPEMVNPKSELYEKHPDWILKLPNRKEDYYRNQLNLDLCNPAVQEFVYSVVDELLTKSKGIAYIKWDCNRMMTSTYSSYLRENQSNIYIEYVKGLYNVLEKLRKKYPTLPMMLCSGGGGRTDYGALKYFTEFWPSDNTDAVERVFIQWGYSYFFPVLTLSDHITSWGKQSLKYRTDVAMMGRLGYDIDINKMTSDELLFSQQAVKTYKRLSPMIWKGDMYHLINPYQNDRAVLMYVDSAKSNAVVFAYNLHLRYGQIWEPVKLEGLDAGEKYKIKEINLFPGTASEVPESEKSFSGDYLMKVGLHVSSSRELTSTIIEINGE
jgi:alpha-galactosidase